MNTADGPVPTRFPRRLVVERDRAILCRDVDGKPEHYEIRRKDRIIVYHEGRVDSRSEAVVCGFSVPREMIRLRWWNDVQQRTFDFWVGPDMIIGLVPKEVT